MDRCPDCGFSLRDPEALTRREKEVLEGLAKGQQNKHIARDLGIAPATVEQHRYHLFQKLHAHTPAEVIVKAVERGVLSIPIAV